MNQLTAEKEMLFDPKNLTKETIKQYLCPLATDQELIMGLQVAKTFNLNPLKREVYFVKYKADQPMAILTGYEVYLKRAEKSGLYAGLETTTEGHVEDGTLKAVVKIYRKDWERPLVHEAYYSEYVQMKPIFKNGVKTGEEPNTFWRNKPKTMIKKVAESQGFRKAFPCEFDGMPYTSDEVIDQERIIDVEQVKESPKEEPKNPGTPPWKVDPDEEFITNEQGEALLVLIAKQGYTKEDLKQAIAFEFNLTKLSEIRNKHLPKIKTYFVNPKVKPHEQSA